MRAKAAVVRPNGQTEICDVEIDDPRDDEVLVEIVATGICHTDMVMRDGGLPIPRPVVLGHEGAGYVIKAGALVENVKSGDPVVLSFASCGGCPSCMRHQPAYCHGFFPHNFAGARLDGSTALRDENGPIHSHIFGQSSFATHAVALARNVVKAPDDLPLESLGPLGCGVQTGVGAILNSLKVESGASVAILGAGAVGLSAVMGAKIASAAQIAAIDLNPARLGVAERLGATHALRSEEKLAETISAAELGPFDYIVDTTGVTPLVNQAFDLLAPQGTLALVAAYAPEPKLEFDPTQIMSLGRNIVGVVEGGADPQIFIPQLFDYHRNGQLPFEEMIEFYPFDDILSALADGERGRAIKPVVRMK